MAIEDRTVRTNEIIRRRLDHIFVYPGWIVVLPGMLHFNTLPALIFSEVSHWRDHNCFPELQITKDGQLFLCPSNNWRLKPMCSTSISWYNIVKYMRAAPHQIAQLRWHNVANVGMVAVGTTTLAQLRHGRRWHNYVGATSFSQRCPNVRKLHWANLFLPTICQRCRP